MVYRLIDVFTAFVEVLRFLIVLIALVELELVSWRCVSVVLISANLYPV